jgi:hypothetical protein
LCHQNIKIANSSFGFAARKGLLPSLIFAITLFQFVLLRELEHLISDVPAVGLPWLSQPGWRGRAKFSHLGDLNLGHLQKLQ